MDDIQLLDVVRLRVDLSVEHLVAGTKGTVVEVFSPNDFLVEFADEDGHTLAMPALRREQLQVVWRSSQGIA
ncbi:DUF4926 domain-containing protein [Gloeobacter morelensis]|uniref:DUF4926 domain-containing protein n=1 Tax=Gloeobacter morelensis MG652769 TaxID=2781736 RepID=A0ABY3PRQ8_9CYAN|nr:DUF4926 domain-containing protein [Gloeobacter morelensis]UFP96306.1 DUF4926 domain-containing protein [Gloeobacter morelensis MG652769]